MQKLSFTQKYYLCSLTKRGGFSNLVCLLTGGIAELLDLGYIQRAEKDKLVRAKPWDGSPPYLKPINDKIETSNKPLTAVQHIDTFNSRLSEELVNAYKVSLLESGCADEIPCNKPKKKIRIKPKPEALKEIVNNLRSEMLSDEELFVDTILLATLLDASGKIGNYFSRFERNDLKKRLKEVRDSGHGAMIRDVLAHFNDVSVIITTTTVPQV